MEYRQTVAIEKSGRSLVIFDIFEVDTNCYFAHPRVPHDKEYQEFYFGKIGYLWCTDPISVHWHINQAVVEALGFVYTNNKPVPKEYLSENEAKIKPPGK